MEPQTIHLCQRQASQEPPQSSPTPLTLEALSPRHVSAKWGLYTVLTGSTSLSTGHTGQNRKQPIIFFSAQAVLLTQQLSGGLILKAGGGNDENEMGCCLTTRVVTLQQVKPTS